MASNINIKVTENVKKQLDDMKLEGETYNVLIQRLMQENKSLQEDKHTLMKIAMKTPDSIALPTIAHTTYFALTRVLLDNGTSDEDKLTNLKSYLHGVMAQDPDEVLKYIYEFQKEFDMVGNPILDELVVWVASNCNEDVVI